MIDLVKAAIERHHMLKQGDSVTVALSGGADSVALLFALTELSKTFALSLSAFHLNHQLRGAESNRDEAFCRALCATLNLPLTVQQADVADFSKKAHLSIEEGARALRYRFLEALPADKIATAHTLSDSAETTLFNWTRGSGPQGLCGIPAVRGRMIRPLIEATRQQVEDYLHTLQQPFVTDSTNVDLHYSRNRIRHQVIPVLVSINPAFFQTLQRCCTLLAEDQSFLEEQTVLAEKSCQRMNGLDCKGLKALHPAIRSRVLRRLLLQEKLPYDHKRLSLLDAAVQTGGAVQLTGDTRAVVRKGVLRLDQQEKSRFSLNQVQICPLQPEEIKFFVNNLENQFKNCIDCDRLDRSITLRTRLSGDAIRLQGRGCTKSLKKLMQEAGLSPTQRNTMAVCAMGDQLVWVEGFGVAEGFAMDEETKNGAIFKMIREEEH